MPSPRSWYSTQAELEAVTGLPDGTPVGAVDTGFTGTWDAVRGLVSDIPAGDVSQRLMIGEDFLPRFLRVGDADRFSGNVVNDVTEYQIASMSIPAGALGRKGRVSISTPTNVFNNTGATQTVTWRLYAYTPDPASGMVTTLMGTLIRDIPAFASGLGGYGLLEVSFYNVSEDPKQQQGQFRWMITLAQTSQQGTGRVESDLFASTNRLGLQTPMALDTTKDFTLSLTVQLAAASPQFSVRSGPTAFDVSYIA